MVTVLVIVAVEVMVVVEEVVEDWAVVRERRERVERMRGRSRILSNCFLFVICRVE
jgi:hypothetical protein